MRDTFQNKGEFIEKILDKIYQNKGEFGIQKFDKNKDIERDDTLELKTNFPHVSFRRILFYMISLSHASLLSHINNSSSMLFRQFQGSCGPRVRSTILRGRTNIQTPLTGVDTQERIQAREKNSWPHALLRILPKCLPSNQTGHSPREKRRPFLRAQSVRSNDYTERDRLERNDLWVRAEQSRA